MSRKRIDNRTKSKKAQPMPPLRTDEIVGNASTSLERRRRLKRYVIRKSIPEELVNCDDYDKIAEFARARGISVGDVKRAIKELQN
jgi:hypothetical protein